MKKIELYFSIDDSGKIDDQYAYSLYAGIVFIDINKRSNFIGKYSRIINSIKCSYCEEKTGYCHNDCPEIKSSNISPEHRRQLLNIIKKEYCFTSVADKNRLTTFNYKNKKSKRRLLDYSVKMGIKSVIREMMKLNILSKNDDVLLVINIDNENRGTDGIYNLQDSIYHEFYCGTTKNGIFYPPIIFGKLKVEVHYQDSKINYDVQGADVLAGTIRRYLIYSHDLPEALSKISKICNVIEFVPRK